MQKIAIGSDKSGFVLKEAIKADLLALGYDLTDLGTQSLEEPLPYFAVAEKIAHKIQTGEYEKAILICGTGAGMAVVANKFKGVYAVACESTYSAEKARAINGANVLAMGGWIVGEGVGCEMAKRFLTTEFTENLEQWRAEFLKKAAVEVSAIENRIYR